jgi:outer membrane protein OmpA-like peptidoglycan-associated protein
MVNQPHAVQPSKPSRSAPAQRSASNPKMGNQAAQRLFRDGVIQAKLTVNQPGDRFEQEADRMADAVMRMPEPRDAQRTEASSSTAAPRVQRVCLKCQEELHSSPAAIQRLCSKCEEELHRKEAGSAQPSPTGIQLPSGVGLPLPESVRSFFEPRFGRDFGHVRIHTGSDADESARNLNALAYTAGSDIVFAKDHYSPNTTGGRRLLAHELTHVIQQGNRGGSDTIQRKCKDDVLRTPGCVPDPSITPPSKRFLFNVNCDDFAPGQEAAMDHFAGTIPPTTTIKIVGLASFDGDPDLNDRLSCSRATKGEAVIKRSAPDDIKISSVDATVGGPSTVSDLNMRAVGVNVSTPVPPKPKCGPEATDWFVRQVNTAMTDPFVLLIKASMADADKEARKIGLTVDVFAEAGGAAAVLLQEAALRFKGHTPPVRAGAIVGQIAAGSGSLGLATTALTISPVTVAKIGALLGIAALGWRALVNHKARYDFKMHTDSMHMPHTAHCPEEGCPSGEHGTITLCPGTNPENCYESDLPGNLFYALIGRHVGFSELTLQLGSQFAELTDLPRPGRPAITWDTPDDTAAISLGFRLPLPLTQSALCSAIGPARATLASRTGCADCLDSAMSPSGSARIR